MIFSVRPDQYVSCGDCCLLGRTKDQDYFSTGPIHPGHDHTHSSTRLAMAGYTHLLALHILFAVIGIGPVTVIALLAIKEPEGDALKTVMTRGRLILQPALLLMLLTGIGLLWVTGWSYMHTAWFLISFVLFIALGAFTGILQKNVRKATTPEEAAAHASSTRLMGWLALLSTVVIVWLMVTKP